MLKDLFTEKKVPIINNSFVEEEDFITFAVVNKEYINEDGDYQWIPNKRVNGIVYSVQEHVIRVATVDAEYTGLYMDTIIGSPTFDADSENKGCLILGIMKNAISKEDK